MVSLSLLLGVLLLGAMAAPHCVGMCACGLGRRWLVCRQQAMPFLWGRFVAYTSAGALAGWGSQSLAKLVVAALPLWPALQAMLHVALLGVALCLLVRGRYPTLGRLALSTTAPAWRAGLLWVLWPCGALYSALTLAYLSGSPWQGGVLMAAFAGTTSFALLRWVAVRAWVCVRVAQPEVLLARLSGGVMLFGLVLMLARAQGWLPKGLQWPSLGLCF